MKINCLNIVICLFLLFSASSLNSEQEKLNQTEFSQIPQEFVTLFQSVTPDEQKIMAMLVFYQLKLNEAQMAETRNWQEYNQKLKDAIENTKDPKKIELLKNIKRSGEPENEEQKIIWNEFDLSEFQYNALLISNHVKCIRILGLIEAISESEKFAASTKLKNLILTILNNIAQQFKNKEDLKSKAERLKTQHEIIFKFYKFIYNELKKNKLTLNITIGFDERLPDPNDILENRLYPGYVPRNCPYLL